MTSQNLQELIIRIKKLPAPGQGFHPKMFGVCRFAAIRKIKLQTTFELIRKYSPTGSRNITDKEIWDSLIRAFNSKTNTAKKFERTLQFKTPEAWSLAIKSTKGSTELLKQNSSYPINNERHNQIIDLLRMLYEPTDYIYIGEKYGKGILGDNIRKVSEWIEYFSNTKNRIPQHIIPNPLSGVAIQKDNKIYMRSDANVSSRYFVVIEFDQLPIHNQLSFFLQSGLPFAAIISSGGKSYHGWLDARKYFSNANGLTTDEWSELVTRRLKPILKNLGADPACFNASRLSRTPGAIRESYNSVQNLILINQYK